ncbi:MAG: OsmC family protein [Clostridia bacterium]
MAEIVSLRQDRDYAFFNDFGPAGEIRTDEAPPVGGGSGPTPVQLLEAAVGNCLAASLLFSLRKFKQSPEPIHARVEAEVGRNEQKRMRVLRLKARLVLGVPAASLGEHLARALAQFEDFCTVTASVRAALPVDVEVYDSDGKRLK